MRPAPSDLDTTTLAQYAKQPRSGHTILLSDVADVYAPRHFDVSPRTGLSTRERSRTDLPEADRMPTVGDGGERP